jgi:hypothetical protein
MEPCGCQCCENCLRCQLELKHKDGRLKLDVQKVGEQSQKKDKSNKRRGSSSQIKSRKGQIKSSETKIKSPQSRNKPAQSRDKVRKPSRRTNKAPKKGAKFGGNSKNSPFFAKILEILRKWRDAILEIFKKLCRRAGLNQNKTSKLFQKGNKHLAKKTIPTTNHESPSVFAKILEILKKCRDAVSEIFKRLCRRADLNWNKTSKLSQKGNKHLAKKTMPTTNTKNSSLFISILEAVRKWMGRVLRTVKDNKTPDSKAF